MHLLNPKRRTNSTSLQKRFLPKIKYRVGRSKRNRHHFSHTNSSFSSTFVFADHQAMAPRTNQSSSPVNDSDYELTRKTHRDISMGLFADPHRITFEAGTIFTLTKWGNKERQPSSVPSVDVVSLVRNEFLRRVIKQQNLRVFLTLEGPALNTRMKDFYSKMYTIKGHPDLIAVEMDSRTLFVSAKLVGDLLRMPYKGTELREDGDEDAVFIPTDFERPSDFGSGDLNATGLSWQAKACHELLVTMLLSRSGSPSRCTAFERCIIYHMVAGRQLNWPVLILNHMTRVSTHFPYGYLITAILKALDVNVEIYERVGISEVVRPNCFISLSKLETLEHSQPHSGYNKGGVLPPMVRTIRPARVMATDEDPDFEEYFFPETEEPNVEPEDDFLISGHLKKVNNGPDSTLRTQKRLKIN